MKVNRVRYQFGQLWLRTGVKQETWFFRYYEVGSDGKRHRRNRKIGTRAQYPTKSAAMQAVEAIRWSVNNREAQPKPVMMGSLIERYKKEELPQSPQMNLLLHPALHSQLRVIRPVPKHQLQEQPLNLPDPMTRSSTSHRCGTLIHKIGDAPRCLRCANRWPDPGSLRDPVSRCRVPAPRRLSARAFRSAIASWHRRRQTFRPGTRWYGPGLASVG